MRFFWSTLYNTWRMERASEKNATLMTEVNPWGGPAFVCTMVATYQSHVNKASSLLAVNRERNFVIILVLFYIFIYLLIYLFYVFYLFIYSFIYSFNCPFFSLPDLPQLYRHCTLSVSRPTANLFLSPFTGLQPLQQSDLYEI